jgi:hypothetical protein
MTDQSRTSSWPANDPATRRWLPTTLHPAQPRPGRGAAGPGVGAVRAPHPASGEHNARASKILPLGVTSSFQHWDPYPISIVSARGAHVTDVDGRKLLDMSMGFGAMMVGHLNPVVVDHVRHALDTWARSSSPRRRPRPRWPSSSRTASARHAALHPVGHRVAHVCRPRRPRLHRPQGDRQDRRRLPRRLRRAAGLGQAGAGRHRPGRRADPRHALRGRGGHRPRRAVQRPRPAARPSSPSTAARSPRSSWSRSSRTSRSSSRTRAISPGCARPVTSTASSSSSTRSRPASPPGMPVPPSGWASSPTWSPWPRASAAGCRWQRSVGARRSCRSSSTAGWRTSAPTTATPWSWPPPARSTRSAPTRRLTRPRHQRPHPRRR